MAPAEAGIADFNPHSNLANLKLIKAPRQTVCFSGLTTQVDNPRLTTGKKTNKMNYL
jgi:hypothetical protein